MLQNDSTLSPACLVTILLQNWSKMSEKVSQAKKQLKFSMDSGGVSPWIAFLWIA